MVRYILVSISSSWANALEDMVTDKISEEEPEETTGKKYYPGCNGRRERNDSAQTHNQNL